MERANQNRLLLIASSLYYISVYISDSLPGGYILTIISLLIILVPYLSENRGYLIISATHYIQYIVAFLAFCVASRLWAENSNLVVGKINSLIFILLSIIVFAICLYRNPSAIDILLNSIMYGGYIVCIYVFARYGWKEVFNLLYDNSRISSEYLNANTLGMCAAYAIVINIHFILYDRLKLRDMLSIPAIILLAVSGSRKAIIIVIIGVLALYALKNSNNKKNISNLIKIVSGLVILIGIVFILSKIPFFGTLTNRMNNLISLLQGKETRSTSTAWIRLAYNRLGIQLFLENPILGIGMANANIYTKQYYGHNHYLHNNYVELLACGGIVGFIIYYSIWIMILFQYIKHRRQRSRELDICFVLLVIHLVMDYGQVTYYLKETYLFLLLFWKQSEQLKESVIY